MAYLVRRDDTYRMRISLLFVLAPAILVCTWKYPWEGAAETSQREWLCLRTSARVLTAHRMQDSWP